MDHPNALPLIGASAAVVAGACLAVKSAVILATGWQPPVLFEVAIPAMAVAALLLAWTTAGGTSIQSARALGVVATIAGIVAVATEVAGSPLGPAIVLSTLATLAALLIVGLRSRPGSRLGFASARQVALGRFQRRHLQRSALRLSVHDQIGVNRAGRGTTERQIPGVCRSVVRVVR